MEPESDARMPLTAHLGELRTRLIRAILATAGGALVAWLFIERLVAFLLTPLAALRPEESFIIGTGVTEAFFTKLKVAVIAGLFVSSPILFYQAWRFVAPGLFRHEKSTVMPVLVAGGVLFYAGTAFAFFVVVPRMIEFFRPFAGDRLAPLLNVTDYFMFVAKFCQEIEYLRLD